MARKPDEFWVCENGGEICRGEPGHVEELDECQTVDLLNEQHAKIKTLEHLILLVSHEFETDMMSVQCFDIQAIVMPVNAAAAMIRDDGP